MPVQQKPKAKTQSKTPLPDPYRRSVPAIRSKYATDWDSVKNKARSVGFPVEFKNIASSPVGLGVIRDAEHLERLEQQIRDALEKHSDGLQVLKA